MAATVEIKSTRFVISGNDHIRRGALKLHGASPRKDGAVTLPLNVLSWYQITEALSPKRHEYSDEVLRWRRSEERLRALGRSINKQVFERWDMPDLWEWQSQALARFEHGSVCLFDDRGLGKTRTTIEAVRASQIAGLASAVIITSKRLRDVWRADAERWWGAGRVVLPRGQRWSDAAGQIGDAEITVLTYDSILNSDIVAAIVELDPEWLVLDEAHNLKKRARQNLNKETGDKTSTKSGALRKLPGRRRVALTGTPMPQRWHEVWTLLNFVAPETFTSYWQFVEVLGEVRESFWGGKDISEDIKRTDIWEEVYDRWIVARPRPRSGKRWDFQPVTLSPIEARAYEAMQKDMRVEREGQVLDASNTLAQLVRLQQLAGGLGEWDTSEDPTGRVRSSYQHARPSAKLDALTDLIVGLDRVVVFTQFRNRAEFYAAEIGTHDVLLFTGAVSEIETANRLARFASGDETLMVAMCVYGTISEGVNELVSAHDIVFLDWRTVKDVEQAADRLDRPGQTTEVRCITLYSEGTIDEAAIDREADKVRPLREILRSPEGWAYLIGWDDAL